MDPVVSVDSRFNATTKQQRFDYDIKNIYIYFFFTSKLIWSEMMIMFLLWFVVEKLIKLDCFADNMQQIRYLVFQKRWR